MSRPSTTGWPRLWHRPPAQKYLPLADLVVGEPVEAADGSVFLEATASLTGHGRVLLGGQYEPGAALSPVFITVPSRHD
jgi:hypothetical protein